MNWHLQNIPRIMHVYWGGGKLSYLRYLTVETFHYYNPDWEIKFYYPLRKSIAHSWNTKEQKYGSDWDGWMSMLDTDYVQMIPVPWEEPIYKNMSEVHRSDYIRLLLLSTIGGLWVDMDILFFKPIDSIAINHALNENKECAFCINSYGHSIGFMLASEKNEAFKRLEKEALKVYNKDVYQCMGAELYNRVYPYIDRIPNAVDLGMDAVYFYNCTQIKQIFGNPPILPQDNLTTVGIHWYAGSKDAGDFLNKTKGGENPDNSLIGKLIKEYERNFHTDIQR